MEIEQLILDSYEIIMISLALLGVLQGILNMVIIKSRKIFYVFLGKDLVDVRCDLMVARNISG